MKNKKLARKYAKQRRVLEKFINSDEVLKEYFREAEKRLTNLLLYGTDTV